MLSAIVCIMAGFVKALFRRRVFPVSDSSKVEKTSQSLTHLTVGGLSGTLPLVILFLTFGENNGENNILDVFIAVIIASLCSLLTYFCFCEYKSLLNPQTSFLFTCYQISGEFPAFITGWCLILNKASAIAACAKTISGSVDYSSGHNVRNWMIDVFGLLSYSYQPPDFLGVFAFLIILVIFLSINSRTSALFINLLNVFVVFGLSVFFITFGSINSDGEKLISDEWAVEVKSVVVIRVASISVCIFFTSGLMDACGRPMWRGKPAMPIASAVCVISTLSTYVSVAYVLYQMIHSRSLTQGVLLIEAFEVRDVDWARYVMSATISITLLFSLLTVYQSMCTLIEEMASEGLLFRILHTSNQKQTRLRSSLTLAFPIITIICLVSLNNLIESLAISYLIVSALVPLYLLHNRYQIPGDSWQYLSMPTKEELDIELTVLLNDEQITIDLSPSPTRSFNNNNKNKMEIPELFDGEESSESETDIDEIVEEYKEKIHVATLTNLDGDSLKREPTLATGRCVTLCLFLVCLFTLPVESLITSDSWYFWVLGCFLIILCLILLAIINRMPEVPLGKVQFRLPLVSFTAGITLILNLCLLVNLIRRNWIWMSVYLIAGGVIYFAYSFRHSSVKQTNGEAEQSRQQVQLQPLPRPFFWSSQVQNQRRDDDNNRTFTQVDTILVRR